MDKQDKQHRTSEATDKGQKEENRTKPSTEEGKGLHDLVDDKENEVWRKTKPLNDKAHDEDE